MIGTPRSRSLFRTTAPRYRGSCVPIGASCRTVVLCAVTSSHPAPLSAYRIVKTARDSVAPPPVSTAWILAHPVNTAALEVTQFYSGLMQLEFKWERSEVRVVRLGA